MQLKIGVPHVFYDVHVYIVWIQNLIKNIKFT